MTLDAESTAAARDWLAETLDPEPVQWRRLEQYVELLLAASTSQNLIAASTVPTVWQRHIVDSAQLVLHAPQPDGEWLDLGSGAGLPGIVAAILRDGPVTLVESRRLRGEFLQSVCDALGLTQVRVVIGRLETVPQPDRPATIISARAFAPLDKLIMVANRFAGDSTRWVLPKGRNAANELANLPRAWQRRFHVEQSVTDAESSLLVATGRFGTGERQRG